LKASGPIFNLKSPKKPGPTQRLKRDPDPSPKNPGPTHLYSECRFHGVKKLLGIRLIFKQLNKVFNLLSATDKSRNQVDSD
jgi:hypothetical protein